MGLRYLTVTDTFVEFSIGDDLTRGGPIRVDFSAMKGNKNTRAERLEIRLQGMLDFRTPLTGPSFVDDPDALVDPERADFFHDNGDLLSRSHIVRVEDIGVRLGGSVGERYSVSLSRARIN